MQARILSTILSATRTKFRIRPFRSMTLQRQSLLPAGLGLSLGFPGSGSDFVYLFFKLRMF